MILQSLATFTPAAIADFGLMHLFWRDDLAPAIALKVFLGTGLGIGIASCLYFLRLLVFPGQGGYMLIQLGFLMLVLVALFSRKRISLNLASQSLTLTPVQILLGLAALAVAVITVYYLIAFARVAPHGDYDAQAIWNLRARFIYRSGDAWANAFSPLINRNFHMDYPLLVPLSVVGGWNTLGSEVLRVPAVLSMLFLFSLTGIVYSTITYLRSGSQAAMAFTILLATPGLLLYSRSQTADIPFTYYFIGSATLFILAGKEDNRSLLFFSGMMAGLAAWTKNEGLPFLLVMLGCAMLLFGIRRTPAHVLFLGAGMIFPLLTVIVFKITVSANNDLFTNNPLPEVIRKRGDADRYSRILNHLFSELMRLGDWPVGIILVMLVYGTLVGLRKADHLAEHFSFIVPIAQLVIYIFIYVITPHNLEWHMNYSMSRLLMHIFPLALLSFFLFVNTPERALGKE